MHMNDALFVCKLNAKQPRSLKLLDGKLAKKVAINYVFVGSEKPISFSLNNSMRRKFINRNWPTYCNNI